MVASYDAMMSQYGTQQQRLLRCVGFQALNKLSRFVGPEPGRSPRAARLDTLESITRHSRADGGPRRRQPGGDGGQRPGEGAGDDGQRLAEFLGRHRHFGQGLLALERFGMFRNHPSRVALSGEAVLTPTPALLADAVVEEFESDLGLQVCIGEVADALAELAQALQEPLFVET